MAVNTNTTTNYRYTMENHRKKEFSSATDRILCAVMTNPTTICDKAVAVNNTWGRRCDVLLFICEKSYPGLPILHVNVSTGRSFLSVKHRVAFDLIYRDYLNKADWFFKADDDTYVLMENLRSYLSDKDSKKPAYYGHHFEIGPRSGFITGGSGYVMSWEALKRLGERKQGVYSNEVTSADDLLLGYAMEKLGVKQVNGLDSQGRHVFHQIEIHQHLSGFLPDWYSVYEKHSLIYGIENMTDRPITFHYVTPQELYAMEYFLYRVRPIQNIQPMGAPSQ